MRTHVLSESKNIQSDALLFRIKEEHIPALQKFKETYPATASEIIQWLETNRYWTVIPFIFASDLCQWTKIELWQLSNLFNDVR
jgi:hypothetical protein